MKSITQILKIKYPLIQAPMNWLTDAKLVAAVSNAGGIGILGPNAGQISATKNQQVIVNRMQHEIQKVRQLTSKPFGMYVNSSQHPGPIDTALLQLAFKEHISFFTVVGNPNLDLYRQIKTHGGIIIARPLTPTVRNAQLAVRYGADILVATGYDEGGVLPQHSQGTFTTVPMIADAVNIPVLAAGGINDVRGVNAALALGAQGVYIGTRFLVTKEAPASSTLQQAIINGSYDQMDLISNSWRSLPTLLGQRYSRQYQAGRSSVAINQEVSRGNQLLTSMRLGNLDDGIVSVNTGIDTITDIVTVEELVHALMANLNS